MSHHNRHDNDPTARSNAHKPHAVNGRANSQVQGEGDYEAARHYRKETTDAARTHDSEREARDAAPRTANEARELKNAEQTGLARSKGEDARDAMKHAAKRSLERRNKH